MVDRAMAMVGTMARTVQSTLRPWGGGSGGQAKESCGWDYG